MTDKATVEMTSPSPGTVVAVLGEVGGMAAVGSPLVYLQVEGAGTWAAGRPGARRAQGRRPRRRGPAHRLQGARDRRAARPGRRGRGPDPLAARRAEERARRLRQARLPDRPAGEKPLASPAVRKRALDLGVQLQFVAGLRPGGPDHP
jgi:2-oxoisovalerate dehydrogenase E2 component (dihydrolipoyl transacylase)